MPKIEDGTKPTIESGTTTATTAGKLVEAGQNFLTTVKVGQKVLNTTDSTNAKVTAVDSDGILSISADIFTITEDYVIQDDAPAKSFKIDGRPLQKGGYEMIFVGATDVGINRMNAREISSSIVETPVAFGGWTDSADAAFVSRQAFIDAVELFMFS